MEHFSEFGNIYSFKPYFELKKEKIIYKKPNKRIIKLKNQYGNKFVNEKDFMFNYRFKNVFENFLLLLL